jgi:hypothetical protein
MGNPFVDIEISINNDEFFWSHGLISDETYRLAQSVCNNSRRWVESYVLNNLSKTCQNVFSKVQSETGNINLEDVTLGLCLNGGGSQTTGSGKPRKFQHRVSHLLIIKTIWCWDWLINIWWRWFQPLLLQLHRVHEDLSLLSLDILCKKSIELTISVVVGQIEHTFNKIDPCIDFKINQYLNKQEVKKSLHANTSLYWEACSRYVL